MCQSINQKIKEMECVQMSHLKTIYYYPELREEVGSINAVIIMGYLENYFSERGQVFYKFMEPCNHRDYIKGQSFVEELGMTAAEFRTAFKYIGVVYKSKKAFELSKDKFQGKMYLSYYDRMSKLTYYMRNDDKMNGVRKGMDEAEDACSAELVARMKKIRNTYRVSEAKEANSVEEVIKVEESNKAEQVIEAREQGVIATTNGECLDAVNEESGNAINNKPIFAHSNLLSLDNHNTTNDYNTTKYKDYESKDLSLSVDHKNNSKDLNSSINHKNNSKDLSLSVNHENQFKDSSLSTNEDNGFIDSSFSASEDNGFIDTSFDANEDNGYTDASFHANEDNRFVQTRMNGEVPYDAIKKLFNQICKSFEGIVEWTSWQKQKLEVIWTKYEQDLEIFRIAFEQLESSDFLCGRKKSWKAYLGWILKPHHFADILMGKYRNFKKAEEKVKDMNLEMDSHDWDWDEIERLERKRIDRILMERGYAL